MRRRPPGPAAGPAPRRGHAGRGSLLYLNRYTVSACSRPLARTAAPHAPGIIWVCALLAALLPLDRLFGAELEDGSLDQLLLLGLPPSLVALAKITAHWLTTGVPLLLAAVPLAIMLGLPTATLPILLAGLLLGSMVLSLIGGMGASIVLGARRGGVLLPLLVLPLITPALILGPQQLTPPAPACLGPPTLNCWARSLPPPFPSAHWPPGQACGRRWNNAALSRRLSKATPRQISGGCGFVRRSVRTLSADALPRFLPCYFTEPGWSGPDESR